MTSKEEYTVVWNYGVGIGSAIIFHPFTYVKTLAQIGHEPLAPSSSWVYTNLGLGPMLCYPNVFGYLKHIRQEDGFLGMYRGLGPRLCYDFVYSATSAKVALALGQWKKKEEAEDQSCEQEAWKKFAINTTLTSASHSIGIITAYPFHVVMVHVMAQYVGKEHVYDRSIDVLKDLIQEKGIAGLFAGLAPRLLGEVLTIWMANTLHFLYKRYVRSRLDKELSLPASAATAIFQLIAAQFTYQFIPVSTVMIVNGNKRLMAGVEPLGRMVFDDWKHCWKHLCGFSAQNRGKSLFLRGVVGKIHPSA